MNPPCATCDNKGCGIFHDECEDYQKFKREQDEIRHMKEMESITIEYQKSAVQRMRKRKKTS